MTVAKRILLASVAVGAMAAGSTAFAGGFAVREQSALEQGMSFAGAAAGPSLGSMFWNSAAVTQKEGLNSESNLAFIIPHAELTATTGSTRLNNAGAPPGTSWSNSTDIGRNAYVPASYVNYQFTNYDPNLYIGLGINAPFGLTTKPDSKWAGSEVGTTAKLFTINFNPVIGYKLSSMLAVAVGAQFQQTEGTFKFATGLPTGPNSLFDGTNFGVGATAGLLFTPTSATTIGLGWRSGINQKLDGRFATNAGFPISAGTSAALGLGIAAHVDLKLPDIVTLSIKQAITSNLRAYGTVEWTNWSKFKELRVTADSPGLTVLGPRVAGQTVAVIDAQWRDGWFFSLGSEYDVSEKLTVRLGGAYERTPVPDAQHRILGIPDADRIWGSVGASYNLSETMGVDIGYSHVWAKSSQVDRFNTNGTVRIVADLDASADIISVGLRMKLGGKSEPLK